MNPDNISETLWGGLIPPGTVFDDSSKFIRIKNIIPNESEMNPETSLNNFIDAISPNIYTKVIEFSFIYLGPVYNMSNQICEKLLNFILDAKNLTTITLSFGVSPEGIQTNGLSQLLNSLKLNKVQTSAVMAQTAVMEQVSPVIAQVAVMKQASTSHESNTKKYVIYGIITLLVLIIIALIVFIVKK